MAREATRTGGRAATEGVIPGRYALSVGKPPNHAPDGWRWTKLTDLARLETGHTPSRKHPEYWGGKIPWIGIKDATSNHGRVLFDTLQKTNSLGIANSSARLLPKDTVCLSRTASVGYIVVMGKPMATSQDFVNWVCGDELDYRFLKYVLLAEGDAVLSFASGTTHQTIYFPEVKAFHICHPPLDEQRRIADVLAGLDDKIELNRRTNETLEAMARAVFKSWFVDFDPVYAKAAGKAPAHMDAKTAALFPDAFGEDGLPVGWRTEAIGEHFKAMKGLSYKGSGLSDSGTPLFNLNSILEGGGYKYDGIKFYAGEFKAKHEAGPGDLLVANTEQGFDHLLIGFSALVPPSQGKGIFSHHLYKVQARPKTHLNTAYLHFLLSASPQGEAIRRYSNGTTVNMLPTDAFERPRIIVPPASLVATFSKFAMPIAEKQDAAVAENQTLAALRDLLLPKLMSGELRLRDAEKIIEGAA